MQQWYGLSDLGIEGVLIDVHIMCRFAGIDLVSDRNSDKTTILALRHLPEENELGEQILSMVKAYLKELGMAIKQGIIIVPPNRCSQLHQEQGREVGSGNALTI